MKVAALRGYEPIILDTGDVLVVSPIEKERFDAALAKLVERRERSYKAYRGYGGRYEVLQDRTEKALQRVYGVLKNIMGNDAFERYSDCLHLYLLGDVQCSWSLRDIWTHLAAKVANTEQVVGGKGGGRTSVLRASRRLNERH